MSAWGCLPMGGGCVCPGGVPGGTPPGTRGRLPRTRDRHTPCPVHAGINTSENITFPQLLLRTVTTNNSISTIAGCHATKTGLSVIYFALGGFVNFLQCHVVPFYRWIRRQDCTCLLCLPVLVWSGRQ